MSPLVRKEIRLLLPFWAIAMVLAVGPVWLTPRAPHLGGLEAWFFWTFGFGLILLGMAPFGQEFSLGTFSSFLAQPFKRRQIWNLKIGLVLTAALLVLGSFILAIHLRLDSDIREALQSLAENRHGFYNPFLTEQATRAWAAGEFSNYCVIGFLVFLVTITGGLWATLLFRQTGAALWFVILIPGVLCVLIEAFFGSSVGAANFTSALVLGVYSVAGFIWAKRMFANAQDSQWLGENVALLSLSSAKTQTDSAQSRRTGAFRALLRKEFQSHQISLLIGFGILVLHIVTLAYRKFATFAPNSELRFAVEAVPFLWLLVPWLLGSVTIAEERKLGTMESQLCLPVTRRSQFAVKFIIALLLGIALGGIMPWLVEYIGTLFHIPSELLGERHFVTPEVPAYDFINLKEYLPFMLICGGAALITIASFFTSSLTRNTLHALGGAICVGMALFFLFQWVLSQSNGYDYSLWRGPLVLFIGVPVAIITVVRLSFSNYKTLHAGRNVWLRNLLILSVSLFFAGIAAAVIYQRPWEMAMSLEPPHGPPRLSGSIRPAIRLLGGRIIALLPDGRLWMGVGESRKELRSGESIWNPQKQSFEWRTDVATFPTNGIFIGGSNWVSLAASDHSRYVAALQSDGSLWEIVAWQQRTNSLPRVSWSNLLPDPQRIGSDNDWKAVAVDSVDFVALKTNGTLWRWGNDKEQFASRPVPAGTNSDWAEMFPLEQRPMLMKRDGSIWMWVNEARTGALVLRKLYDNETDWLEVSGSQYRQLVLRRDGTLWAAGDFPRRFFGTRYTDLSFADRQQLTRIGARSDWAEIFSGENPFLAIRKDGSLVKSDSELFSSILGQPSRCSDWLAGDDSWSQSLALAADRTICVWQDIYSTEATGDILAPSRRPFWSLNILSESKN
jgi:ABC-type transport system involved in multi-copper enzyme maturation permease subunit